MKLVKLDTRQFYCLVISPVHTLFIPYKHLTFYLFIWGVLALGGCTRFFWLCCVVGTLWLRCTGSSVQRLLVAQAQDAGASVVEATGLSSAGPWLSCTGSLLLGMWGLPGPGIKPVSPTLAGEFFTTEPPGKPSRIIF